jgi:hypothetical protein
VHLYTVIYMVGALLYVLLEHFDIHCWDNYLYTSYIILYIIIGIDFIYCWYTILYIVGAVVCARWNVYLVERFLCVNKITFIRPNIKFYATSAPYLVERFQIS